MTDPTSTTQPPPTPVEVRPATVADVEAILCLREMMFEDMGLAGERAGWIGACRQILVDGLTAGDLIGVVAETEDGLVVASGLATIRRWLPGPTNPSGLRGYIGSMATLEPWRRQGIGRLVAEHLIAGLTVRGAVDIELHATEAGENIYRSLGFNPNATSTEMTLRI